MTSRYVFDLATAEDEHELRRVLEQTPMPGRMAVTLRREPSFFRAAEVEGKSRETLVCRLASDRAVVGLACRSIAPQFVNGVVTDVGYLNQLRFLAEHRRRGLVARGFEYLHERHLATGPAFYLTTIAADNQPALSTLVGERACLPVYRDLGLYHTFVLRGGARRLTRRARAAVVIRSACRADTPRIVDFLRQQGPSRQFFPCLNEPDLFGATARFIDLTPEDFLLAEQRGQLVGTLGVWDQHRFKQTVVTSYRGWYRFRTLYNLWSQVAGTPRLPRLDQPIPTRLATLPTSLHHDVDILNALIDHALTHRVSNHEVLLLGVHERDSWRNLLSTRRHIRYDTRLFQVFFRSDEAHLPRLDDRMPYLELGCL